MQNITWTIGDVRITRIVEVEAQFPVEEFLPQASPEALAPHAEWLRPHFLNDDGTVTLSIHALLVESAGQKIIVDTCMGEKPVEGFEILSPDLLRLPRPPRRGGLSPRAASTPCSAPTCTSTTSAGTRCARATAGCPPSRTLATSLPAPSGSYCRSAEEAPFTSTLADSVTCVIDAGLADLVESRPQAHRRGAARGHPWAHPGPRLGAHRVGGRARALITGDVNHHPVQWAEPTWDIFADDVDPAVSLDTRRRLVREHTDSGTLVIGTHYPTPTAGHLLTRNGSCRFEV